MSRRTSFALAAFAIALAAALGWWAWRAPVVPAPTVQVAPLVGTLLSSARMATSSRVDVGSTVTGRVREVTVREGALVRRSDVLVGLESDELRAALARANANDRQAVARLTGLRSTGRSAAQAAVAQADSVLLASRADLQRTQDQVARGFLSEARLDEAQPALAGAVEPGQIVQPGHALQVSGRVTHSEDQVNGLAQASSEVQQVGFDRRHGQARAVPAQFGQEPWRGVHGQDFESCPRQWNAVHAEVRAQVHSEAWPIDP